GTIVRENFKGSGRPRTLRLWPTCYKSVPIGMSQTVLSAAKRHKNHLMRQQESLLPDVLFRHRSIVAAPCPRVFRWHERPEALLDLPPLHRWVRTEQQVGGLRDGGRVTIAVGAGRFRWRWAARHFGFIQDEQFCDEQLTGPSALWRHTHRFEPIGP